MAIRFGKKVFATYVLGDDRVPVLTSQAPDEGDVGNPDPGGPGGSDPDGGDIGSPTGGGLITTVLPNITRKNHEKNVFVAKGASVSITYVADGDCTMMPKWGYEDMTTSYTDDGREMTLTWSCPANEPTDSTPVGVEVFVYGPEDTSDLYLAVWDILHVGKTEADIVPFNSNISIRNNFSGMTSSNATLIVPDAVYTRDDDELGLRDNNRANSLLPVNGKFTESGSGTSKTYTVEENAVIISETPLGAVIDRNGRAGGIVIAGDIPEFSGYSVTGAARAVALKIKSFLLKNSGRGNIGLIKAEASAIDGCENVQDMRYQELNNFWTGDGACIGQTVNLACSMEYTAAIGNERLLNLFSFTLTNAARRSQIKKNMSTQACVQLVNENICQDFSLYGGIDSSLINCIAVDDAFFADGVKRYSSGFGPNLNFSFINTNQANLSTTLSRCMNFNSVKSFFWNNNNSTLDSTKSLAKNCISAIKKTHPSGSGFSAFHRGHYDIENCTLGNYEKYTNYSAFSDVGNDDIDNVLLINMTWDRGTPDSIMGGNSQPNITNIGVINPPTDISPLISSLDSYYSYVDAESAGLKYWTRAEDGGPAHAAGLGAIDFWCAQGRYGKFVDDNDNTVYNGDGVPYVNWLQRSPWREKQKARAQYSHTTDDGDVFSGDVGVNAPGVHPVDYFHRKGVSPSNSTVCPYIEDIYHKVLSDGTVRLWWRPVCPAYRGTITGLDFYVDGVRVAENQDKRYTRFDIQDLNSGTRAVWIVCRDTTYGDSGHSRKITAVIP